MKTKDIKKLQDSAIVYFSKDFFNTIAKISSYKFFTTKSPAIIKGHIPIVAYLLKKGHFIFKDKNNNTIEDISKRGASIGLQDLLNMQQSNFSISIGQGSEVLIIDKSVINAVLAKKSTLNLFFKNLQSNLNN